MLPAPGGSPRSRRPRFRPFASDNQIPPGDCARRRTVISSFALARPYSKFTGDELLGLCADRGNVQAWEEFLRRFDPLVMTTVRRTARRYAQAPPDLCEDLAQRVYLKLIDHSGRLLREFVPTHEGASFGYIKVMTANLVHDYFRGQGRHPFESLPEDLPDSSDYDNQIFLGEVDDFLRRTVSERNREIFWFHYRRGMTAEEIAGLAAINLTTKGVEAALKRTRDLVIAEFSGEQRKARSEIVSEG
jgi:RNA polymerase sigma factor (sigma-70 family)